MEKITQSISTKFVSGRVLFSLLFYDFVMFPAQRLLSGNNRPFPSGPSFCLKGRLSTLICKCILEAASRVVSASDSQSGGSGVESHSGVSLDLFSVIPSSNPQPRL